MLLQIHVDAKKPTKGSLETIQEQLTDAVYPG